MYVCIDFLKQTYSPKQKKTSLADKKKNENQKKTSLNRPSKANKIHNENKNKSLLSLAFSCCCMRKQYGRQGK